MTKYLVDVYIPASGRHIDAFIPAGKLISDTTALLVRLAESICGGSFKGTPDTMLLDAASGRPFDRNINVFDAGIRNSSKLLLI
ncbi:MAG: hypothetical protein LBS19_01270 [Clostridiales bacterium]|jgi:hypothetical protein|nr:hypothetical protein [Clostridiales bacterium]